MPPGDGPAARRQRQQERDDLVADLVTSPFRDVRVPDAPPGLFAALSALSGRSWTPEEVADYERARLFVGWEGLQLDDRLRPYQHLADHHPGRSREDSVPLGGRVAGTTRTVAPSTPTPPRGPAFDPHDLGD